MSRLVIEVELPDYNVDDVLQAVVDERGRRRRLAPSAPEPRSLVEEIDEELEVTMGCDAGVVVVFHRVDDVDGHVLEHLTGRITRRRVEQ